ncbi:MAG: Mur ligase family protein [Synergistaceae bacterium]|nr:Mur ligase family protein [Synergistaceae bacterium]
MLSNLHDVKHRILVTGTRAKSSLVRLLHEVFVSESFLTRSRITGVVPRELSPIGERIIRRTSPGHIREMEWWASQINSGTQAIVVENSAVAPELQRVAAKIVSPTMVVWTNCRPDHEEVWGPGKEGACRALLQGIPEGIPVACGVEIDTGIRELLKTRGNVILNPIQLPEAYGKLHLHLRENMELASAVCQAIGFPLESSLRVMASLPLDIADFQIVNQDSRQLAAAFSANEPISTLRLFESTSWEPEKTTLLYHHRVDRVARLVAFLPWINSLPWKRCIFTRNLKLNLFQNALQLFSSSIVAWNDKIQDASSFLKFWEGQVFGCGNVAGWPLDFLLSMRQDS